MANFAIAHQMKRKAKKMAEGGSPAPGPSPTPSHTYSDDSGGAFAHTSVDQDKVKKLQQGFGMAEGGRVGSGKNRKDFEAGINRQSVHREDPEGVSNIGHFVRSNLSEPAKNIIKTKRDFGMKPKPNLMAEGGLAGPGESEDQGIHMDEMESGYLETPMDHEMVDDAAMREDSKDLNQHSKEDMGPYGAYARGGDIVDRIMHKRYSEGGKVANATPITAGFRPDEFDDLVLRDGLSSDYGDDDNSGDQLGNAREDRDRDDIVARVMAARAKKDRMPRPA